MQLIDLLDGVEGFQDKAFALVRKFALTCSLIILGKLDNDTRWQFIYTNHGCSYSIQFSVSVRFWSAIGAEKNGE